MKRLCKRMAKLVQSLFSTDTPDGPLHVQIRPRFNLVDGPLAGATDTLGISVTFPDGEVRAKFVGPRPGYWLLYEGENNFGDGATVLYFKAWVPMNVHIVNEQEHTR